MEPFNKFTLMMNSGVLHYCLLFDSVIPLAWLGGILFGGGGSKWGGLKVVAFMFAVAMSRSGRSYVPMSFQLGPGDGRQFTRTRRRATCD